mmetsp:Transcript_20813/g.45870  ORF Transcript_20813/g.45870 Transcript_20813/m.45870 type:complete len:248 (-) Transcript_20813:531-1274(-)
MRLLGRGSGRTDTGAIPGIRATRTLELRTARPGRCSRRIAPSRILWSGYTWNSRRRCGASSDGSRRLSSSSPAPRVRGVHEACRPRRRRNSRQHTTKPAKGTMTAGPAMTAGTLISRRHPRHSSSSKCSSKCSSSSWLATTRLLGEPDLARRGRVRRPELLDGHAGLQATRRISMRRRRRQALGCTACYHHRHRLVVALPLVRLPRQQRLAQLLQWPASRSGPSTPRAGSRAFPIWSSRRSSTRVVS